MSIEAVYFDGRQARRHPVTLTVDNGVLRLNGHGIERREALTSLNIPPPLGNTPRLILFADGARCEVADLPGFSTLLPAGDGHWLVGLEKSWLHVLSALLITLGLFGAAYCWGLPYAARLAADKIPATMMTHMDSQFFARLDQTLLRPTALPLQRRQAIQERIQRLSLPFGTRRPHAIEFRGSPAIGANAFALPGGSILVLDELVALGDDEDVIAVLAHEMGHVNERHALRQMLQASVVGLAMTWYIGDISSLLAAAPATLLQTRYSRDFERRADRFAAEVLRGNGISPARLADMLDKLQAAQSADSEQTVVFDYLSTHPDTRERIAALRGRAIVLPR